MESPQRGTVRLYDPYVGTVQDNRLKIEAAMSEDGLSVVYAARHLVLDRRVTVKVLRSEYAGDDVIVEHFLSQARHAAKLDHPNLAQVLDSGRFEDGSPFVVAEFLGTRTLRSVMDQDGPLPWSRALSLVIQACAGLEHAHRVGVVHGNLCPEDLVLVKETPKEDRLKVSGFGTSQISVTSRHATKTGFLVGVPEYMSPEQAAGRPTGPWTDMYSLSVILFEMITGKVPFESDSFMGALGKHMLDPIPDPRDLSPGLDIPDWLVRVLKKALAKTPRDRFESMADMAAALALHNNPPEASAWDGPPIGEEVDDRAPTRVYEAVTRDGVRDAQSFAMNPANGIEKSMGPEEIISNREATFVSHREESAAEPASWGGGVAAFDDHSENEPGHSIPWTKRMVSLEQVVWAAVALALGLVLGLGILWLNRDRPLTEREPTQPPLQSTPAEKAVHDGIAGSKPRQDRTSSGQFVDLVVETEPAGAEVELDGRLLGISPLRIRVRKAPGAHLLTARLAGFTAYRTQVSLAQTIQLRIQLDKPAWPRRKDLRPGRRRKPVHGGDEPVLMDKHLAAPSGSHARAGKKRENGDLLDPFEL